MINKQAAVRLGLIGAGRWGRNYISTIGAAPNVALTRLGSRAQDAQSLVDANCTVSADWRDVVEAGDLDGLVLAVPPQVQVEIALSTIKAELPVLLEKPMATTLEDALRIRDTSSRHNVPLMVDHIYLFHPAFVALKQALSQHRPIRRIRSVGGNAGPYRSTIPPLWDWAPHDIAMCLELVDEFPDTVHARRLETQDQNGGEIYAITLTFPSGTQADITTGNGMTEKKRQMHVECDDGAWLFDDLAEHKLIRQAPHDATPISTSQVSPLSAAVQSFVDALRKKHPMRSNAAFSANVVSVISEVAKQVN